MKPLLIFLVSTAALLSGGCIYAPTHLAGTTVAQPADNSTETVAAVAAEQPDDDAAETPAPVVADDDTDSAAPISDDDGWTFADLTDNITRPATWFADDDDTEIPDDDGWTFADLTDNITRPSAWFADDDTDDSTTTAVGQPAAKIAKPGATPDKTTEPADDSTATAAEQPATDIAETPAPISDDDDGWTFAALARPFTWFTDDDDTAADTATTAATTGEVNAQAFARLAENNSRLYRGVVWAVIPDETFQEMLDAYKADDKHFREATGHAGILKARPLTYVVIRHNIQLGGRTDSVVLAEKSWRLKVGDIVDYYNGGQNEDDLRARRLPVNAIGLESTLLGFWRLNRGPAVRMRAPAKILGIVCRKTDDGCRANATPSHTIGFGRPLSGPEDYRGVAFESQQPMENHTNIRNPFKALKLPFFSTPTEE